MYEKTPGWTGGSDLLQFVDDSSRCGLCGGWVLAGDEVSICNDVLFHRFSDDEACAIGFEFRLQGKWHIIKESHGLFLFVREAGQFDPVHDVFAIFGLGICESSPGRGIPH